MIDMISFLGVPSVQGNKSPLTPSKLCNQPTKSSQFLFPLWCLPLLPVAIPPHLQPQSSFLLARPYACPSHDTFPPLTYRSYSIMPISFPHHLPVTPNTKGTPPVEFLSSSGPLAYPRLFKVFQTDYRPSLGLSSSQYERRFIHLG